MKRPNLQSTVLCSLLCAVLDFCLVPLLIREVADFIWIGLMLILPAVAAGFLLRSLKSTSAFGCGLVQLLTVTVFAKPLGQLMGYHLTSLSQDLFDYLGYLLFAYGIILGSTLIQFLLLKMLQKYHR